MLRDDGAPGLQKSRCFLYEHYVLPMTAKQKKNLVKTKQWHDISCKQGVESICKIHTHIKNRYMYIHVHCTQW